MTAATTNPPGLTTQFDLISHIPNDHDTELLAFLDEHQLLNGYTNYWVAFRLAFLSRERMQYSAALPYKEDMSYNAADNHYKPYAAARNRRSGWPSSPPTCRNWMHGWKLYLANKA